MPIHGEFWQAPYSHLKGFGCQKCGRDISAKKQMSSINKFLNDAKNIHGDNYDYSLVEYNGVDRKIKIICKRHGIFEQTPYCHIKLKTGCPQCNESKGERAINLALKNNNVKFSCQYKFKDCKNIDLLPFDFQAFISDKNEFLLIEYDGEHHFKPVRFGGISVDKAKENFKKTKKNDEIKTKYCKDNNIKLIRIPYWEFENIE